MFALLRRFKNFLTSILCHCPFAFFCVYFSLLLLFYIFRSLLLLCFFFNFLRLSYRYFISPLLFPFRLSLSPSFFIVFLPPFFFPFFPSLSTSFFPFLYTFLFPMPSLASLSFFQAPSVRICEAGTWL
jgi:hypothetical protein